MFNQSEFSLLAATRHIGWGGVGKLRLILEKLPCARVVLHGDEGTIAKTKDFLGPHHKFEAHPPRQLDVALVINDPPAANVIADLGVPVVYVDSLPYVHKTDTDVPELAKLACYCAQKYPIDSLPLTSPLLRKWQDIRWIDPIVPTPQSRRGGRGIVINVGGLYVYNLVGVPSELVNDAVDAYLNLVLFPLVDVLQRSDRQIAAICGNINESTCRRLRGIVPDNVAVGPQSPHAFQRMICLLLHQAARRFSRQCRSACRHSFCLRKTEANLSMRRFIRSPMLTLCDGPAACSTRQNWSECALKGCLPLTAISTSRSSMQQTLQTCPMRSHRSFAKR